MQRLLISTLVLFMPAAIFAQYGDFGLSEQPADTQLVNPLIDFGEMLDFSHGYHVGDTVYDFTVYDFNGNPLNLYNELAGEKPVVLVSGSVSCLRFRGVFEVPVSQTYFNSQQFLNEHADDFNWIFIYGVEAHPTDGNCPSNCPPTTSNDTTVLQHPDYHYRRWAVETWEVAQDHDFPFTMYCDNPDNAVYNNFFGRPFGLVAINCDGTVAHRGDWFNQFIDTKGDDLLEWKESYTSCAITWEPEEEDEEPGNTGGDDDPDEDTGTDPDNDQDEDEEPDNPSDDDPEDGEDAEDDPEDPNDDPTDDDEEGSDGSDDEVSDNGDSEKPAEWLEGALNDGSEHGDEAVSVAEKLERSLRVYPNPVRDVLYLQLPDPAVTYEVQLTDLSGKSVLISARNGGMRTLDLGTIAPGMYLLSVQHGNVRAVQRVVVSR